MSMQTLEVNPSVTSEEKEIQQLTHLHLTNIKALSIVGSPQN